MPLWWWSTLYQCAKPAALPVQSTDYVLSDSRKAAVMAVLKPLLPVDAVVCTDGGGSKDDMSNTRTIDSKQFRKALASLDAYLE